MNKTIHIYLLDMASVGMCNSAVAAGPQPPRY
jgi:hypothetical protein